MMMSLGLFVFSMQTLAYNELQRQTDWRHPSNSRVGARAAYQYTGPGEDQITLPGVLLPQLSGTRTSLDVLREMANTGRAWVLVDGTGRVYGAWIIERLTEGHTLFFGDGAPRRIEFTLSLKRIDEDVTSLSTYLGEVSTSMGGIA